MASLTIIIEDVKESHPDTPINIRGDSNVNPNNLNRCKAWKDFLARFGLSTFDLGHPTYHHFIGHGSMDNQLDVLVSSSIHPDKLADILCSKTSGLVKSSHDVIISSFSLCSTPLVQSNVPKAPRITNKRFKIVWDKEGASRYALSLASSLLKLMKDLGDHTETEKVSSLLTKTTHTSSS